MKFILSERFEKLQREINKEENLRIYMYRLVCFISPKKKFSFFYEGYLTCISSENFRRLNCLG